MARGSGIAADALAARVDAQAGGRGRKSGCGAVDAIGAEAECDGEPLTPEQLARIERELFGGRADW